jgi:hypothetical protein
VSKTKKLFLFEALLITVSFLYFLFFVNRGFNCLDEGYYLHGAQRILSGQIPYKDFYLQYSPGYFYILAFLYEIFGPSMIAGRFLALFVCLLTIIVSFLVLKKFKMNSYLNIFLTFLCFVSLGFPLVNIPNLLVANVLVALLLVSNYSYWLLAKPKKQLLFSLTCGLLLALSFALKQNFGLSFTILFSVLLIIGKKLSLNTFKNLLLMYAGALIPLFIGVYVFFLKDNLNGLTIFINFSKQFTASMPFTYPPIKLIFQPTGIFKLLPYYLPFVVLLTGFVFWLKGYKNLNVFSFAGVAITGFFTSVYPNSEITHVYPFLGLITISFLLFPFKKRLKIASCLLVVLMIVIGFYLTFFTGNYYYGRPYFEYNIYLNLPRTQGILLPKSLGQNTAELATFMNKKTTKNDYILAYPYCPCLYFVLDRPNPSKDFLYFLPNWHFLSDQKILGEMKNKNVKYIVANDNYSYTSPLSYFIQKQKKVFKSGVYSVFEISHY